MRKYLKKNILEIIQTIYEAHIQIKNSIEKKDFESAQIILGDCQDAAVHVGTAIEDSEGAGLTSVGFLEEYCETVYEVSTNLSDGYDAVKAHRVLDKSIRKAENSIKNDIKVKFEIVFLPYKASMWDSLESVWKATVADSDCDAYVIPIPYYDRNSDHSFGDFHYEGGDYPDYVPIVNYEDYDFETRRPDAIYIHNPYDGYNYVTSVDPRFYSDVLKKYTDCLVYIPYFLFPKVPEAHLIDTAVLHNADCIFVQNEPVKEAYITEIKKYCSPDSGVRNNVFALGSPKIDKIYDICQNGIDIPDEWVIQAEGKKKMFLNTNVSLILNNNDKFVENLSRVFQILNRRKDVFVIWREHPLTYATLKSMRPGMIDEYEKLKSSFIESGLGILDTNVEAYESIYFSDCYFGAGGSLTPIYAVTGKPMLLTAYKYPDNISPTEAPLSALLKQADKSLNFSERYVNFIDLFLDNLELITSYKNKRFELLSNIVFDISGTVGSNISRTVKNYILRR